MINLEVVGEGATSKVYRDGAAAIKLYVNVPYSDVENEANLQKFAYNSGLAVPKVIGVKKHENGVSLEMEYINGQTLLRGGMDKDERRNAVCILAKLQCEVHKINAVGQKEQSDIFAWKINNVSSINEQQKNKLLNLLNKLKNNSSCLCHGDFHPLNILFDGNKYWIIDWVDAAAGNPLADACRTYIIFLEHMKRSAGIYLREFCKEAKASSDDVLEWLPILAAIRLYENINITEKTRLWLLDLIH